MAASVMAALGASRRFALSLTKRSPGHRRRARFAVSLRARASAPIRVANVRKQKNPGVRGFLEGFAVNRERGEHVTGGGSVRRATSINAICRAILVFTPQRTRQRLPVRAYQSWNCCGAQWIGVR
jgi:hypothetical protein